MNYFEFNAFEFGNDEHDVFIKNNKPEKKVFCGTMRKKKNELNLNGTGSIT